MSRSDRRNTRHMTPDALRGMRWRGLVRESSAEQAEKWSPERQRSDIRRAADELGLVPAGGVEFYERVGSGEREAVPELRRALEDGRRGEYQVLVVLATSRFARNATEARVVKRDFSRAGIVIYFASDRIISGSRTSRLTEGIKEVIDEEENETRRMWVAGGIRERQLSGRWMGRIPVGYRRLLVDFPDGTRGWDGGLEIDPATAAVVREMYSQLAAGVPASRVAINLNLSGSRRPTGRPWTPKAVREVVLNPVYKGDLVRYPREREAHYYPFSDSHDGRRHVGRPFPALVDERVWEAAQASEGQPWTGSKSFYPLSGVMRCAECGQRMQGMNSGKARYYRCSGRMVGVCSAPHVRADRAEASFAAFLADIRLPDDWREALARVEVKGAVAVERDRVHAVEERLARLKNLYAWGDLSESEYRSQSQQLRAEASVMVMPDVAGLERMAEMLRDVGALWMSIPEDRRRELPGRILSSLQVRDAEVESYVVRPELRPLIEMGVVNATAACIRRPNYTVRYSA